jgi:type II secretory pathway component GspD/PulD (secretin)
VASGQTAELGGLMLDSFEGKREGSPVASRIPFFGDLVSNRNDRAQKSELVVFIRPVVVREASVEGDLADYRKYLPDRDFFRDTRSPMPKLERELERVEGGGLPHGTPVPIVPDAAAPGTRP